MRLSKRCSKQNVTAMALLECNCATSDNRYNFLWSNLHTMNHQNLSGKTQITCTRGTFLQNELSQEFDIFLPTHIRNNQLVNSMSDVC